MPSTSPRKKRERENRKVCSPADNNLKKKKKKAKKQQAVKHSENGAPDGPIFPLYDDMEESKSFHEGFAAVARLLRNRRNIAVLTGAGISTTCGIPDFRSRGGLYASLNLEELGISTPEELFDWDLFQDNPKPFFKFARNLYFPLGDMERARPSDSHKLLSLLENKKKLLRVYSQNIDGLEQEAGVSPKKVVYAHGSLRWATCLRCKRKVPAQEIEADIIAGTVAYCNEVVTEKKSNNKGSDSSSSGSKSPLLQSPRETRRSNVRKCLRNSNGDILCGGVLKPGVTFFGQSLNDSVGRYLEADRERVDALIVIGTSLSVAPISKVIGYLPHNIPRILINRTIVHPASKDSDEEDPHRDGYVFDAYLLGNCDDVTRELAKHIFASSDEEPPELEAGRLLANVRQDTNRSDEGTSETKEDSEDGSVDENDDDDENLYKESDWASVAVPRDRVFLFPGAQPPGDNSSGPKFQELAHCDGCGERIKGTIQKCAQCFDYDLCESCYPTLSKTHCEGKHTFFSDE